MYSPNKPDENKALETASFPALLPLVSVVVAAIASFLIHPNIVSADRVSVVVGTAIAWSMGSYVAYRIAKWRKSDLAARWAWLLLAASALAFVWNG